MIKLSASVSKKIPLQDVECSTSCSAGAEAEMSNDTTPEELKGEASHALPDARRGRRRAAAGKRPARPPEGAARRDTPSPQQAHGRQWERSQGHGSSSWRHPCHRCRAWPVRTAAPGHAAGEVWNRRAREPVPQGCVGADRVAQERKGGSAVEATARHLHLSTRTCRRQ